MVIWGMLVWWYTDGWRQALRRVEDQLDSMLDYFSFGLLLGTLFAPFRQISAGKVKGTFDMQLRAFFDRLISRAIGTVVRLVMIVIGSIAILANILIGLVFLLTWAIVPLLPLIGLSLFILGWLPWNS